MPWTYVLDSAGTPLGELRAYQRTLSVKVSTTATASCRIRDDDPLWLQVRTLTTNLRVYNPAAQLVFYGPIVSKQEAAQGQGGGVQLNAVDLSWRLSKRWVGKDKNGVGVTYTGQDSGDIAFALLAAVNAEAATGITAGAKDVFVARTITYLWQRCLDKISELGAIQGSFEWVLRYVDANPPTVYLDLKAAVGGDQTQSIFFDYGTGKANCSDYTLTESADEMANDVWTLGSGSTIATEAYDTASEAEYGRLEDVVTYGDITVAALLTDLAAAHIAIRKQPRAVLGITPATNLAPRYGSEWNLGDFVSSRVVDRGQVRVAGFARIWGADISIDDNGNEQPTVQLEPQS